MRHYFSKRHSAALREKRLRPSISIPLRVAIKRTLDNLSEFGGDYNDPDNITFYRTEDTLKTFYGEEKLLAFDKSGDGKLVPSDIEGLIARGYPSRVLDLIEAWCDNSEDEKVTKCERELNSLFEIHNSPWRIVNKSIIRVDSEYLHSEVIARTQTLLKENAATGALEEFSEAVSCLTGGETKDAIINAHKSVESVMKTCLDIKEHKTYGELLRLVVDSGLVPEYYEEFLTHFEKLALAASKERNQPARGHGQGSDPTIVPKPLAEFALHLAGAVNLFMIQRWIDSKPKEEEPPVPGDDIPF